MRVLVTGSSGHVGGAIARLLLEQGFEVAGLSRIRNPELPDDISQFEYDISDPDFVENVDNAIGCCDAVVHAAAHLTRDPVSPIAMRVNGVGTQHVIDLAKTWDVSSFIYISGVAVIGRPLKIPITEDHPAEPTTAYLASKLYGEQLVGIAAKHGLPAASLRLSAPVGPGMPDKRVMKIFVKRAMANAPLTLNGRGTRRQNYVDVRDAARAVLTCINECAVGTYNIGGKETVSNHQLAERIITTLQSSSGIEFSGTPDPDEGLNWTMDLTRAREAFAYSPQYSLDESIRSVAEEI